MESQHDRLVRWALRIWVVIGAGLLVGAVLWLLREPLSLVVTPVAIAAVLVYLLDPIVSWAADRGVPRPLGTLAAYVVAAVALWGSLLAVGPLLVDQAGALLAELPTIGSSLQSWTNERLMALGVPPSQQLDIETAELTVSVRDWLATNRDQVTALLRGAGSVVSWVVHLALAVTLGPILAFYALADLDRLTAGLGRLLPPDRRSEAVEVTGRIGRIVGAYFRGQLAVATFVGAATALGLLAVGLPFWAVVGATTGVFNLVPLVGPTAGGVLGVLVALTVGGGVQQAVLVVVVMVAVQQVDNHLITPMVVGRSVSIHPITVILALVVAGSLGGIPLMFIAIPAAATGKLVLLHLAVTRLPSMAHLADDLPGDETTGRQSITGLAADLRASFERRVAAAGESTGLRRRDVAEGEDGADAGDATDDTDAPDVADRDVSRPTEAVGGP